MSRRLAAAMQARQLMAMQGRASVRIGLVSSYDPANYCVKVRIQPEDSETGWLPVVSPWVGNGWGMFAPPTPGDMVEVQFQEDNIDAGFACLRFFNDSDRPLTVPSGEFWLVHKNGAFFKLTNDGKGSFSDGHGATISLNGDGTITSQATQWNHTGPMTVSGLITGHSGIAIDNSIGGTGSTASNLATTGTLTSNGKDISSTHKHGGVTTGAGQTAVPI